MATMVLAHRGFSGVYPENTMLAFEKALEAGAHGLELDVQLTQDGIPVVFHDEDLQRVTGVSGLLSQHSWQQLQELEVGSFFDPPFRGEQIPSLQEVLQLAKDRDIFLNIELKNGIYPYPGLVEKVVELVREFKRVDGTIVSSFHHPSLLQIKRLDKEMKIGLLYFARLFRPQDYASLMGADSLHPYYLGVDSHLVQEVQENNLLLIPYLVNKKEEMKSLLEWGVDAIITDYPDLLWQVLEDDGQNSPAREDNNKNSPCLP